MQLRQHTEYWEERADKVLSHVSYTYPDEINIYDICWRYGMRILPLDKPFLEGQLDYESLENIESFSISGKKNRRGTIYIKEGLDDIIKRLLVAEEFCHLYAHHSPQMQIDQYALAKNEQQAKRMAAYLLMPQHLINDIYDAALEEAVCISEIADYFLVTDEFAQFRLELIFNHKIDGFTAWRGKLGTLEWID